MKPSQIKKSHALILLTIIAFLLFSCKDDDHIPSLTTLPITSITISTAISGGSIVDDGGFHISDRGVCWDDEPNPTKDLATKTLDGEGSGDYTSTITGLQPGTTYYVRAYATNAHGVAYGDELMFSTSPTLPSLSTLPISPSSITLEGTATSGGNIEFDGGSPITARGICWSSTTASPTISLNTKTTDGNGVGNFTSLLIGLTPHTYYYVRAYATNLAGTSYAEVQTFWMAGPPSILDFGIGAITSFDALFGFALSNYTKIDEYGVCWSTSPNPTIEVNSRTLGWNRPLTGNLRLPSSYIVHERCGGLNAGTTYFVRGYAKNSYGVTYSDEVSFVSAAENDDDAPCSPNCYTGGGTYYAGGYVFYVDNFGKFGLIVAPTRFDGDDSYYGADISSLTWGCKGSVIGTGMDGLQNTNLIVTACDDKNNAATHCDSFVMNSFSDWYLPSIDELDMLYSVIKTGYASPTYAIKYGYLINTFLSSTEADANSVWVMNFATGIKSTVPKDVEVAILPVRKF